MSTMRTAGRTLLIAICTACVVVHPAWPFESFAIFGRNTHEKLFDNAKANISSSDYPDIERFKTELRSGAENEAAHNDATGVWTSPNDFWSGNEGDWNIRAKSEYSNFDFTTAYTHFGYVAHLVEDIEVPAHKKIDYHGPLGFTPDYRKSPDEPLIIIRKVEVELDDLESYAGDHHQDADGTFINFNQPYRDPNTNCDSKFWLDDGEDADSGNNATGAYGRNRNGTCAAPDTPGGADWFGDIVASTKAAITNRQLYLARTNTEAQLIAISRTLRPLPSGFTMTGAGGGAPVIVNTQSGSPISFMISENRSAGVAVDLFVRETGQKIITEAATASLAGSQSASGSNVSSTLSGPLTWDAASVPLAATKATDKSLLPFAANIQTTWKGVVAGGAALADGNYTLCLNAKDGDSNDSSTTADHCDTSVLFTTKPVPFSLDRLG